MASPLFSPDAIREQFLADGDAAALLRRRSAGVDAIVTGAFDRYLAPQFASGLALLAVGGYGREELCPHSDIDLLVLVERDLQGDANRSALSAFLRSLWDAGLRLSQSVRTPAECCRFDPANVEFSISLIDQRLLIGDRGLYEALKPKLAKYFEDPARAADTASGEPYAGTSRESPEHDLSPRAEREGESGRDSRSARDPLAWAGCRGHRKTLVRRSRRLAGFCSTSAAACTTNTAATPTS